VTDRQADKTTILGNVSTFVATDVTNLMTGDDDGHGPSATEFRITRGDFGSNGQDAAISPEPKPKSSHKVKKSGFNTFKLAPSPIGT
jgi:hypothetical protein